MAEGSHPNIGRLVFRTALVSVLAWPGVSDVRCLLVWRINRTECLYSPSDEHKLHASGRARLVTSNRRRVGQVFTAAFATLIPQYSNIQEVYSPNVKSHQIFALVLPFTPSLITKSVQHSQDIKRPQTHTHAPSSHSLTDSLTRTQRTQAHIHTNISTDVYLMR